MTQGEVINKLSMEMALALGDLNALETCRTYIQMALSIGIEHFAREMEEVIAMDFEGVERGRFKGIVDAADKLGLYKGNISDVIQGKRHSHGGLIFVKTRDFELIPAKKTA